MDLEYLESASKQGLCSDPKEVAKACALIRKYEAELKAERMANPPPAGLILYHVQTEQDEGSPVTLQLLAGQKVYITGAGATASGFCSGAEPSVTVDAPEFRQFLFPVTQWTAEPLQKAKAALIAHIDAHTAAVTAKAVADERERMEAKWRASEEARQELQIAAQAQAPEAATGYPLAVLTLGGIDGDEFDSWDLEVFSGDAIDKLQQQLVRSSKPVILNLYAAELAAPQQHAQAAQPCTTSAECNAQGCCNPRGRCEEAAPAQPIAGKLPPMPRRVDYREGKTPEFTVDQMRTYGHQCRAAALEEFQQKLALAYGILWHVNAGMDAPPECEVMNVTPERAAYEARKALRDMLTKEQRGHGIHAARDALAAIRALNKGGA